MAAFKGLGKALRWLRQKQGRKQYEVAAAAGITKGMVSVYELEKQRPNIETLERILDALDVDLDVLYDTLQLVNEEPQKMRRFRHSDGRLPVPRTRKELPPPGEEGAGGIDLRSLLGVESLNLEHHEEEMLRGLVRAFRTWLRQSYLRHQQQQSRL